MDTNWRPVLVWRVAAIGGLLLAAVAVVVVLFAALPEPVPRDEKVSAGAAAEEGIPRGQPSVPPAPHNPSESEFESLDEAREVQSRLRKVSQQVAPAVVAITYRDPKTGGIEREGSGVVIDASGLILTHGHHDRLRGTVLRVTFPDGRADDAEVLSVYSGSGRDFSLLKLRGPGPHPSAPPRPAEPLSAGERCFHLGYPQLLDAVPTPMLRLGRIAADGRFSTYANCLITSGDSGGPLFDFRGRVIGVLNYSIGPDLAHPGQWASISKIRDGNTFLTPEESEVRRLGFLNKDRRAIDTRRWVTEAVCPGLLAAARRATVEVLIDDRPVVLGTIVDADGLVLSKRSEVLTHRGAPLGTVSCRLFDGERVPATVAADSQGDDLVLLRISKLGLTVAPWSPHEGDRRGTVVIVPVPGLDASETGVVSVDRTLPIAASAGRVPLSVAATGGGVAVTSTADDLTPFERLIRGTIRPGDVITHVDGRECPDLAAYNELASDKTFVGGDFVLFTVRREGSVTRVAVPIEAEPPADSLTSHRWGNVSLRRSGFRAVVSHDAIVPRRFCGGPLVDLEGRVLGINIARIHRFSTLAIPQETVRTLVRDVLKPHPKCAGARRRVTEC